MKKSLLALAVGVLFSAAAANAVIVYYDNPDNWTTVGTWEYGGPGQDIAGTTEKVTIGDKVLYKAELQRASVIFRNGNGWGNGQTDDIENPVDNAVYTGIKNSTTTKIVANIVDGAYVAVGGGDEPDEPVEKNLYIAGTFTGFWSIQPAYMFTKGEDGLYTIEGVTIEAGGSFKLTSNGWPQDFTFGGTDQGNNDDPTTLTGIFPGQSYELHCRNEYVNDNTNLFVRQDIINATFTFNAETKELTISENGEGEIVKKPWWVAWDINGGTWSFGHEMEKQTENTYKYFIDCSESTSEMNYFAIFNGDSATGWDDNNNVRYQPANVNGDQDVTATTTYNMMQGGAYAWKIKNGKWTVLVDPTDVLNMTITFELGDSTGEANVLIDRAADGDNEGIYESYGMTEDESDENTYTWSGSLEEGDKLKFNIHGVDYTYDPAVGTITSDDHDANVTMEYELTEGDGMVAFDYEVGEVTFKVDIDNKKVYMTYKDAPDVTLTVTEGENSTIHRVYKQSEGYYQTSHTLSFTEAESVDFRVLSTRYVPDYAAGQEAKDGYRYPLVVLADDAAAPAFGGETGIEYYVTVVTSETSDEPNYVFFTTEMETAVAEIAVENGEAVYFNMQGMRIANPENGLYIVVKDGKAGKVIK